MNKNLLANHILNNDFSESEIELLLYEFEYVIKSDFIKEYVVKCTKRDTENKIMIRKKKTNQLLEFIADIDDQKDRHIKNIYSLVANRNNNIKG